MTRKANTRGADERNVLTVRLPASLHDELRTYGFFTNRSINEVVVTQIEKFLAAGGRKEIERAMTKRATATYRDALDKLADS